MLSFSLSLRHSSYYFTTHYFTTTFTSIARLSHLVLVAP